MNDVIKKLALCLFLVLSAFASASPDVLKQGSGKFLIEGGLGLEDLNIAVHYHMPKNFNVNSDVLMVLPGSGRTAHKYRDRWVQSSEKYSVLILAPSYSKIDYPRSANYNLARMVKKENNNFIVIKNQDDWIFSDLDRIFNLAVKSTRSNQTSYDLFGHSAGGQLGHRFAMFYPESKVRRILAANSGWYTAIDFNIEFPYGLAGGPFVKSKMNKTLKKSFAKQLVVFLGDKDDKSETRGSLRRGVEADKQGLSRIERGKYFYNKAKQYALTNKYMFNWGIHIVPDVGHSSTQMSAAAAEFLYDNK